MIPKRPDAKPAETIRSEMADDFRAAIGELMMVVWMPGALFEAVRDLHGDFPETRKAAR